MTQLLENAKTAPEENHQWIGQTLETEKVKIIDPAVGKGTLVRSFFFKKGMTPKGEAKPTKLQIISHYKKMIEMMLWKDGLTPMEDEKIQLYTKGELKRGALRTKMIEEGADFVIMVLATARLGSNFIDTMHQAK